MKTVMLINLITTLPEWSRENRGGIERIEKSREQAPSPDQECETKIEKIECRCIPHV